MGNKSNAKVCMITTNHSAQDDRIFYKESKSLEQAGYEVTLLAPLNSEGFLIDMGGNRIAKSEASIQNIKIIGFDKKESRLNNLQKLMNLITLQEPKFSTGPYTDLIARGIELDADVYHCHEISSLYAGIQIKKKLQNKGREPKLVYDVHEFTPAAIDVKNRFLSGVLRRVITHFEKEALKKHIDYAITANQITRGYLLTLNRFIQTEVIYNSPILSIFKVARSNKVHKSRITICHEGSLGFNRGLKQMIEVMRVLKNYYGKRRVELLIVGDVFGEERKYLKKKLEEYDLQETIQCTGWLPYEKVGEAISHTDIGIIFMEPTENNMLAGPPNKLFNYMRYKLPVVSVHLPETTRIISRTKCGIIVKERTVNELTKALSILIEDESTRQQMGENGRKAVEEKYNWENEAKKLISSYGELLCK
jgi:glycosyltransferase involved in cell wall biosynthesis